jgi:hypothetical protein
MVGEFSIAILESEAMFRMIALIRAKSENDVPLMVGESNKAILEEPSISSGRVVERSALRVHGDFQADYALVLDFADKEAFERDTKGEAHKRLVAAIWSFVASSMSIEYVIEDAADSWTP